MRSFAVASALAVVALAAAGGPVLGSPGAGAQDVGSLQAQAAQLSRQLLLEQLQVGGFQQQYQAATDRSQVDGAALAATQSRIAAVQGHIAEETGQLRQEAVKAYIDDGTGGDAVSALFTGDTQQAVGSVYRNVVAGNLSTTLDQLHTDRQALGAEETDRQRLVAQDQADQAQAQAMLERSQQTQQDLEGQQAQVTGQLAQAVARQQQAEAAAAQEAVRTAQAQAEARPAASGSSETVVSGPTPTTNAAPPASSPPPSSTPPAAPVPVPVGSSTDPALPPFLVCVIHYESGGDYQAVSPDGQYMGAFQFSQSTWNVAAQLAGRPDLVGVPPNRASKADQDTLAVALYNADGTQPWYDPCSTS